VSYSTTCSSSSIATVDRNAQQRIVKRLQRSFARVLDRAGLPAHHTMHSLRHSFASIQVSKGASIAAVQQWLGRAWIAQTVDTYGASLAGQKSSAE
jgi:site-specific recombinase XerD